MNRKNAPRRKRVVVVRHVDEDKDVMKKVMLDLVYVSEGNGAGSPVEGLCNKHIASLTLHNNPLSYFIGAASDRAADMVGAVNSVSSRLRDSFPATSVLKCISKQNQIIFPILLPHDGCPSKRPLHCSWSSGSPYNCIFKILCGKRG